MGQRRTKRAGAGWRSRFLRALARTANARLAARMAGVDHTTAYQLRQRDSGFAAAWVRALDWGRARVKADGRPVHSNGRPRDGRSGVEARGEAAAGVGPLVLRNSRREGAQIVRAGEGRWTEEAEDVFLAELWASANVKRAAATAGFSTTAVYKRRMIDPGFAQRWDAAKAQGTVRIDMLLIEAAERALDPDTCEAADEAPRPTIGEAIQIARLLRSDRTGKHAGAARRRPRSLDEVRDSIVTKLSAFERHRIAERIAQGWVKDEAGNWIPPGWERTGGRG